MINANRKTLRIAAAAVAAGAIAAAGATLATSWAGIAHASGKPAAATMTGMAASGPTTYQFTTLDNANDLTFNQLLGINNSGTIAGYFGSGAAGHPNKGYLLLPPYGQGNYQNENFPVSVQTQVTGLNDNGVSVGFWSTMNTANQVNNNFGFYELNGGFHSVVFPTGDNANPVTDQLLGVNDHDVAVGFYTNGGGLNRGYTYNINTHQFGRVWVPGYPTGVKAPSTTAAAINNNGDIAGFWTNPKTGNTDGFLFRHGKFIDLAVHGASSTQALGVNDHDEVVGDYTVGTGSAAVMHGFTWTPGGGFATVDDPDGIGTTTINGVNDAGDLVGFYVDGNGNTDGFLAKPVVPKPVTTSLQLMSMPQGTATLGRDSEDDVDVTIDAFGLTPGSAHNVELVNGAGGVVADFSMLTANTLGQADATLDSGYKGALGAWRVVILNGTAGDSVSTEPIAETSPYLPGMPGTTSYQLTAIEVGSDGTSFGTPAGSAVITYNPKAQTISVTVNASGVTPGPHAAHIHVGSCQSQGPVQYMLADFIANANGQIVHETRTVTDVTSPLPATGWYLNLHQGDMNNIVSNGNPTINFRPLLCGNIVTNG
jgi:hypothetical protein